MNQIEKDFFIFCCQSCINSYKGRWGEVKQIFDRQEEFKVEQVEGFFGYKNNELFIVFQGSVELSDWIDNFKFHQKPMSDFLVNYGIFQAKVHSGFLEQYEIIKHSIFSKINECNYNKIIITGHSLGAAIATLCYSEMKFKLPNKNISLITFGSPKVGNQLFTNCCENSYRIVNSNDIVPEMPPKLFEYNHINSEINIGKKKWYKFLGSIIDHNPKKYLENLINH